MSEELKNCPFCGSQEIIVNETDEESMSGFDSVECGGCGCGCEIMGGTVKDWNTRTLTPKQQHADEMYDVLKRYHLESRFVYGEDYDQVENLINRIGEEL